MVIQYAIRLALCRPWGRGDRVSVVLVFFGGSLEAMAALCGVYMEGEEDLDGQYPMHWAARQGRQMFLRLLQCSVVGVTGKKVLR